MLQSAKKSFVLIMCIILSSCLSGCLYVFHKPKEKIGYHLEKIKDIHYKLSLKKLDTKLAASKMMSHVISIQKLSKKIAEDEHMKDFLSEFVSKWTSEEKITASLMDGKSEFMSEVNVFFVRGYIKVKDGWKTLFPIFKP